MCDDAAVNLSLEKHGPTMRRFMKSLALISVAIGLLVPRSMSAQDFGGAGMSGTVPNSIEKLDFNALVANGRLETAQIGSERAYEALRTDMSFVMLQNALEKGANFHTPSAEDEGATYAALKLYPFKRFAPEEPAELFIKRLDYVQQVTPKEEPTYRHRVGGGVALGVASHNSRDSLWKSAIDRFETVHSKQLGAIARIGMECTTNRSPVLCEDGFQTIGTAFLVLDGRHLLTARHVFYEGGSNHAARDIGRLRVRFDAGPAGPAATLAIDAAYMRAREDIAVIEVRPTGREPLRIAARPIETVERGVSIGYPAEVSLRARYPEIWDISNNTELVLAPGYLTEPKIRNAVEWNGPMGGSLLLNTASLAGGNSGSPIFNLDSGELIGLHVCGYNYKINVGIGAPFLSSFIAELIAQRPTGILPAPAGDICSDEFLAAARDAIRRLTLRS
ncbi:MAG: hypothetical protein CVT73_04055 [Alphaproteobacteria bacterium HGW-Alphaproteobacteria-12]|nr:MAG: hypothetical protein CVT73_04055 [Alphaproteobacteria bacterium HGW-Alphaproteobacteria-12]